MPAPTPPITVAIGRFEDLVGLGLRTLLAGDPNVSLVAHDIADDRLTVVLQAHRPLVAIIDVKALSVPAQIRDLAAALAQTHLVLLGQSVSVAESAQMLAFGASACLSKDSQLRDIQTALHLASRGLQVMPSGPRDIAGEQVHSGLLTRREGDVLALLRTGRSNPEIAEQLGVGVETVRTHVSNIFRKLGVTSRRALIAGTG